MKRWFVVVAVCALALVASVSVATAGEVVRLRVFSYLDAPTQKLFDPVLQEFTQLYPHIQIVHETVAGSGAALYPDALKTALLSGDPPDLFLNWAGTLALPYIRAGQVMGLDKYYAKYGWESRFVPWAVERTRVGGVRYGVPVQLSGVAFWYRTDLFQRFGLSVPRTYAELEQVARALQGRGVHALSLGGKFGWHTMRFSQYLLEHTAGPKGYDGLMALEVRWDSEPVVQALGLLQKWVSNRWLVPNFLNVAPDDARFPVFRGQAAMVPEGPWFERVLVTSGQDRSKYDFFVPPTDHDPVRYAAWIEQFMIPTKARHPDEAALLLDFLTKPETMRKLRLVFPNTPVIGVTPDEKELPMTYKWQLTFVQQPDTFNILDQALEKELTDAFFAVQDGVIAGKYTPQEGARMMQEAVERWKARNR